MFFFSVQLVGWVQLPVYVLAASIRGKVQSHSEELKVADCIWFQCPQVWKAIISFLLLSFFCLNQVGKIIVFFSFCYVFGACAQWKHSPLSVARVTSFIFFPHFILILCVSPPSRCSPSEGNAAMIPPNLVIWRRQKKQVSGKRGTVDNVTISKAETRSFVQLLFVTKNGKKTPAGCFSGNKTNKRLEIKRNSG